MKVPRRLSDLSRADFEEIAAATNPTPGPGMIIDQRKDSIVFSVSTDQLKRMIYSCCHQMWPASCGSLKMSVIDGIDLSSESLDVTPET